MKPKSNPFLRNLLTAAALGLSSSAYAADGTWSADTTPLLWSGTGNWASGAVADGSGFAANFTNDITGDRVVDIDADKTISNIVFGDSDTATAGSWTIGNNGVSTNNLILAGTTPTITVNALGTAKTATISAIIEGTAGLNKAGIGTLTLSGTNTYTGLTSINAGTLKLSSSSNNNISSSSGINLGNSASLDVTGLSGGQLVLASGQNVSFTGGGSAAITGSASNGALRLNGNNTLSVTGGGTLSITRLNVQDTNGTTSSMTGGNVQVGVSGSARGLVIGNGTTGTFTLSGGTLTSLGGSSPDAISNNSSGTFIINGGNYVNAGTLMMNIGGGGTPTATVTLSSGTATIGTLNLNNQNGAGRTSIVNLEGGTLQLSAFTVGGTGSGGTTTLNMGGGATLRAGAALAFPTLSNIYMKNGGVIIDSNSFAVSIGNGLQNFTGATTANLTKTGTGTLTLSSTANDYTGGTTVRAGTLALTGALSSSSALAVGSGATFSYDKTGTNAQTVAGLTVNPGKATVNNTVATNTLNLGGISRATGNGVLNFATATGEITTTQINVSSIIAPWALFGGTKYATGSTDGSTVTTITGLTGTTQESEASWTSNTANYEVTTTTGQTLTGNRTSNTFRYSGTGLTIGLGASGTNTFTTNGILAAGASGTLTISRAGGIGTVVAGNTGEIVIAGSQAVTISAPISSGVLTYGGTGTLTLSGANTYSGGTYINSGTVSLGVASTGTVTNGPVGTGSVYLAGGTLKTNNFTIANNIVAVANTSSVLDSTGNATLNGNLSGSGTITKTSGNQVVLGGNNSSFSGIFTETGTGPLSLLNSNAGSASAKWVQGAASTWIAGTAGITVKLGELSSTVTTGTIRGGSALADGTQVTFEVGELGSNATYSGKIQDYTTGKLVKSNVTKVGTGTWTLTGANTYSGTTTLNAGTLTFGTGGTLGTGAGALAVNNPNTGAGTAVVLNLATAVDTTVGSLSGTKATPSIGTNASTINNGGAGRNFTVNQTADGTYDGVIAGAGNFTLGSSSTNKLTLTGISTYTGETTVKNGTLNITGSTASGSAVAVGGDSTSVTAKLTGSGTINGAVSVKAASGGGAAGILNAGDATAVSKVGTLSMGSTLNFETGSIFEWNLASSAQGTRGTGYDGVNVTGALSGSGAIFKVILDSGNYTEDFWTSNREWIGIFTASNAINMSGMFSSIQWWDSTGEKTVNDTTAPGHFSFTNSGTTLSWTAVPELSNVLIGGLLGVGLLGRRRK